jgi:hypothetical protein
MKTALSIPDAEHGLARNCSFDMAGFRNALSLRAELEEQWGGIPPEPKRYLELGCYERALKFASP